MKYFYTAFALTLVCMTSLAQTRVIGLVTEKGTGEPMPAISVVIKNASSGTLTDLDGNYSIEVKSADDILQFSCLGYRTEEVKVDGRSRIDVRMTSDINTLDEVVVLGYTSIRRAELASSAVSVQGETLRDVTSADIGTLLQGKVAGLFASNDSGTPGAEASIRIRGTGSITASSDPLFVVDGVIGGTFSPNDVESITVLKDAGATALYGASGAGGVIVVTTKHASKGQDATIEFKANVGAKQMLTGHFHQMHTDELFEFYESIYSSKLMAKSYPDYLRDIDYNWVDEATRLGLTQDYYVSASGNSGKITYTASIDWYDELGTQKGADYDKLSGRLNLGTELLPGLDLNFNMQYEKHTQHFGQMLGAAYNALPYDSPVDCNTGMWVEIITDVRPDNGNIWYGHEKVNAFRNAEYNYNNAYGNSFFSDLKLSWRINDWLSFTTTNRIGSVADYSKDVISPETNNSTFPTGRVFQENVNGESFTSTNILKYSQTYKEKHSFTALAGFEWDSNWTENISASGTDLSAGLSVLDVSIPVGVGGHRIKNRAWSVFGQAQYSFKEKYILNATMRADASSVFAPGSRVGYFPAVSAAWIASSEDFMKSQDIISFLKLRASIGETGNSSLPPYSYMSSYRLPYTVQYMGEVGAVPATLGDEKLHWETAVMANLGVDLSFRNFLTIGLDVYNLDNKDLLLNVPAPLSSGYASVTRNIGRVRNRGVEFQLNSTNISKHDFKWTTSFNIAWNSNKVISLPNHEDIVDVNYIYHEGAPIYSFYLPKWMGVNPENGDPQWEQLEIDENGEKHVSGIDSWFTPSRDAQIVGCAQPDITGGMINYLSWKNFDLSLNLQFVWGNEIYNQMRYCMDSDGAFTDYNMMSLNNGLGWKRWEKEGDIATHPLAKVGGNKKAQSTTSRYLEDGSYLRVKNLSIGYNLPKETARRLHLQAARVFVTGDNLYTLTRFSGMDPEVSLKGWYDYNYPVARYVSLGVDIKF